MTEITATSVTLVFSSNLGTRAPYLIDIINKNKSYASNNQYKTLDDSKIDNNNNATINFSDLIPGFTYSVSLSTGSTVIKMVDFTTLSSPSLVKLSVSKITPTSAEVLLNGLSNNYKYAIVYTDNKSGKALTMATVKQADSSATSSLSNLTPGASYNVSASYVDEASIRHENLALTSFSTLAPTSINKTAKITDFSPKSGPAGTMVTIIGENLTGVNNIYFGLLKAVSNDSSETQINAKVPANAINGDVRIIISTDNNGSATSDANFRVSSVPTSSLSTSTVNTNPSSTTKPALKFNGLVPDCNSGAIDPNTKNYVNACDFDMIIKLINTVITFVLIKLATPLFALILIYVAWLYLSAGGSPENVTTAKKIFKNVVIGYIIALAAWLIVKTILAALGFKGDSFLG